MLYDSDPTEPMSLYVRGGLCFCCQRALNEKRRTKPKRKLDEEVAGAPEKSRARNAASLAEPRTRFKFNDQIIELNMRCGTYR